MLANNLKLHDASAFPAVCFSGKSLPENYIQDWIHDMDTLLNSKEPYYMVMSGFSDDKETHEDRKERSMWFKVHLPELAIVADKEEAVSIGQEALSDRL